MYNCPELSGNSKKRKFIPNNDHEKRIDFPPDFNGNEIFCFRATTIIIVSKDFSPVIEMLEPDSRQSR
jgi:hypothetical protein